MPLPNPTPLTVDSTEAKTFDSLWLRNVSIHAPSLNSGSISIETHPFNAETGEIGGGEHMQPIKTDDLWRAVNEVPEVATAMGAIFAAVEPLRAFEAKLAAELAAESEEESPT